MRYLLRVVCFFYDEPVRLMICRARRVFYVGVSIADNYLSYLGIVHVYKMRVGVETLQARAGFAAPVFYYAGNNRTVVSHCQAK